MKELREKILVRGLGASHGQVTGIVRIAYDPQQALEKLGDMGILVTPSTDPSWTICMHRAKGIVTNTGGILSHAAIVSRELQIPCVVGTINATEVLKDGMSVTVDGDRGVVYAEGQA